MHPIQKAVNEMESMVEDCGLSDNPVILEPDSSIIRCQYETGAVMRVSYGGISAEFSTNDPFNTKTKPSFMFGASLNKPAQRAAAAGIINALSGFLCTVRNVHACIKEHHKPCLTDLKTVIGARSVYCLGDMEQIRDHFSAQLVQDLIEADIVMVTGDGLVSDAADSLESYKGEVLYIGPSCVGIARVLDGKGYCPFGRTNLQDPEKET